MNALQLKAENISSGYDKKIIIDQVSITIPKGKISVIIGANACGKSTLLKTMSRLIYPSDGTVTLDGKSIHNISPKKLATNLGLLPQSPIVPEGITVFDLISRGRFPYQGFMKGLQEDDYKAIERALDMMGIKNLSNRNVDELSGGQRQRVWIAMALAQETDILLLDEPTTFLDISHQLEILDLLTDINREHGTTIVMVLHDINLSARYADYMYAVNKGKILAEGPPNTIISEELINEVFHMNCQITRDPISDTPFIIPVGRHHTQKSSTNI